MTQRIESVLGGGGEMGERIRAFDWSTTPLGPLERWPQSLKISVRIRLDSGYPMAICWGRDYTPSVTTHNGRCSERSTPRRWVEVPGMCSPAGIGRTTVRRGIDPRSGVRLPPTSYFHLTGTGYSKSPTSRFPTAPFLMTEGMWVLTSDGHRCDGTSDRRSTPRGATRSGFTNDRIARRG